MPYTNPAMALRAPRRLPKRFARPVSRRTRALVQKRYNRKSARKRERMTRAVRLWLKKLQSYKRCVGVWLAALIALGFVVALAVIFFSPFFHLRQIVVLRRDPRLDVEQVQQLLKPFFGRHMLLLSAQEVRDTVERHILDAEHVDVTKQMPDTMKVRVDLAPIVAKLTFVSATPLPAGSGAQAAYITSRGTYVRSAPVLSSGGLLSLTVVDYDALPEPGARLIAPEMLELISKAEQQLQRQFGMAVTQRMLYLHAQEFHLQVGSIQLWFDVKTPLQDHLRRLQTFLENIQLSQVKEYIDLRLSGKVVYK